MIALGNEFVIAEIIALFLIIPTFIYMITVSREDKRWRNTTIAVGFLLLSTICALLREFSYFDIFRTLEWLFLFLSSLMFAYGAYMTNKHLKKMVGS